MTPSVMNRLSDDAMPLMEIRRMKETDLESVLRIENAVYPFPWTHGNFADSMASGYETWVAGDRSGMVSGYFLMMLAVDEAHLLNITVRPDLQGRRVGRRLLDKAMALGREKGMQSMLLEVRPSNLHAQAVYQHIGFQRIGLRRNYYPAPGNTREDAVVMRLMI